MHHKLFMFTPLRLWPEALVPQLANTEMKAIESGKQQSFWSLNSTIEVWNWHIISNFLIIVRKVYSYNLAYLRKEYRWFNWDAGVTFKYVKSLYFKKWRWNDLTYHLQNIIYSFLFLAFKRYIKGTF